ncbi:methyltransferase domain-containing protein [Sarocladium implicatum]|nr:methyltransferase domain-containing protein [Sarocladium implicatum]
MSQSKSQSALQHFNTGADLYEVNTGGCTVDLAEVAIQLMHNLKPIETASSVLDNACGTGVATAALIRLAQKTQSDPEIYAADGAENMTAIASKRFQNDRLHIVTARGEKLPFADNSFTHSITNLGLIFFYDARTGAAEILRTLQPGGVAVITGWIDLGYVEAIREAQRAIHPDAQPFCVPLEGAWLDPEFTRKLLEEAGFEGIQFHEQPAYFGCDTIQGVVDLLQNCIGKSVFSGWTGSDQRRARDQLTLVVQRDGVHFTRLGRPGLGIQMRGFILLYQKP